MTNKKIIILMMLLTVTILLPLPAISKVYTTPSQPGFHVKNMPYQATSLYNKSSAHKYSSAYNKEMKNTNKSAVAQYQAYRRTNSAKINRAQSSVKTQAQSVEQQYSQNPSSFNMQNGLYSAY